MNIKKNIALKLAKEYLTEDDLTKLLIDCVESSRRTKQDDELLFDELKKVEGFQDYLSNTLIADKDRYFGAGTPMEQLLVKGAYNRTFYIRSKLREVKEVQKMESPRHG